MFPKRKRLSTTLFNRTFRDGKRASGAFFGLIFQHISSREPARYAAVVSKKVAPRATRRNALRRKVYATLRSLDVKTKPGDVFIVQIKKGAEALSPARRREELETLFTRIV